MSAVQEAGQILLELDLPIVEGVQEGKPGSDPAEEADKWREANPEGWKLLVRWARADRRSGRRCSMKFYGERLRHTVHTNRVDGCPYVINNTAFSGLVRMLVTDWPELESAFETRRSRADRS